MQYFCEYSYDEDGDQWHGQEIRHANGARVIQIIYPKYKKKYEFSLDGIEHNSFIKHFRIAPGKAVEKMKEKIDADKALLEKYYPTPKFVQQTVFI